MFDFAWSELALIGVVALVAIGPKDMPAAIKAVAGMVKKARRMAGEFQGHVEDLIKEADLSEVRRDFGALRSFNLRDTVTRAVDPDGSLRATMADKPLDTISSAEPVAERSIHPTVITPSFAGPYFGGVPDHRRPALDEPPAFIPPEVVVAERAMRTAPAWVPPQDAARGPVVHGDAG